MSGVFISYRRTDSGGWSGRLFDHLGMRFGKDLVFHDLDDIELGNDFVKVIGQEIQSCSAMLVLIGPHWLKTPQGRRLENADDPVRLEVTLGLEHEATIIPILLGGAQMPAAEDLPEPIRPLTRQNGLAISDAAWDQDVHRLIDRLHELILPMADQVPLRQVYKELEARQKKYFELLERSAADALEHAQDALSYLDRVSPLYPHDPYLQVVRGYFHKNEAMALRDLGRTKQFHEALNQAERVFDAMIRERPNDDAAWNGKGNVEGLRGNYAEAVRLIDRALEIAPDNSIWQSDRATMLARLKPI